MAGPFAVSPDLALDTIRAALALLARDPVAQQIATQARTKSRNSRSIARVIRRYGRLQAQLDDASDDRREILAGDMRACLVELIAAGVDQDMLDAAAVLGAALNDIP